jgi:cell division protease FtsH
MSVSDNQKPNGDKRPDQAPFQFNNNRVALVILVCIILFLVVIYMINGPERAVVKDIAYTEFWTQVNTGNIAEVTITEGDSIEGRFKGSGNERFKTMIPYPDSELMVKLKEKEVVIKGTRPNTALMVILQFLPFVFLIALGWLMFRQLQGGANKNFPFGKSKVKQYLDNSKRVMFKDVAGQEESKYELQEVVEFLKNPAKFTKIGARIPKGVLLVGMPGTGKTLLAKAIAGEANVPFFHMSGSDFVEMFVGVGASRVRDLFEQARKSSPCIIFIDELDAVGRTRGAGYGGGHDEREQTLNQMLVEMDGFETKDGVIVIAATNRPDVLDPALMRPGRFDRQVVVDMPDVKEREAILGIHASRKPMAPDVDLEKIAKVTPGSSGADLENLVNEAALFAARKGETLIHMEHFEEARDKVLMGVARKSRVITDEDKRMTAYHEAGHALLHYLLKYSDPLHKVTVIPRGRALGMAVSMPDKDAYSRNKSWLLDRIKICMGGYVAEELIYGETTTGTKNDIEQATGLARRMVTELGMSDELGPVSYGQDEEPIFLARDFSRHKDYSESTAKKIDDEVKRIVCECKNEVKSLLTENKKQLVSLAEKLVEIETLDDSDIRQLLGYPEKVKIEKGPEKEIIAPEI